MNSPILQLLVLAGIAIFLILRLRSVLGNRDGYEKPPAQARARQGPSRPDFEVIEGGPDRDIIDQVPDGSPQAEALALMKRAEPSFSVSDFLSGARGAYEMILMGFERGEMSDLKPFLSDDVYETFAEMIENRKAKGLTVEAEFVGVRELSLQDATFDESTRQAEITVRHVGELTSAVYDSSGKLIEGSTTQARKQKDVWTYGRVMGANDPNWQLIATGE